ncbi:MAG TPA: transporter substrate-binding domain-containing protein [Burkholderiales bacterium]|jgi:polar amino acid transport system substrate-binding protein|nr:transporter substrate-binding domain-containing protein [Burkholderiales bacterium]
MRPLRHFALMMTLLLPVLLAACAAPKSAVDPAVLRELAPTGKLRAGVAVGAVSSPTWSVRDPATGQPRGVAVDLAGALAAQLGVPLDLKPYASTGEITNAGPKGEWDVGFMPRDATREAILDFGPAFFLVESTWLVRADSGITTLADVDKPGVRPAGVAGTTTARSATRSLKNVKMVEYRTSDELIAHMRARDVDAIALGRESLVDLANKQLPGSRVLPGYYQATGVSIVVPKNHAAALAYVTDFMEKAKADGTVKKALEKSGLPDAAVAPPMKR